MQVSTAPKEFYVIHPLFDLPEEKRSPESLGLMPMKRNVKLSLMVLRGYLILMTLMFAYHFCDLMGLFGRHLLK